MSKAGDARAPLQVPGWLERAAGEPLRAARLERRPLAGGIEAAEVVLVTLRYEDAAGRPRMLRYVGKHLVGRAVREARLHAVLAARHAPDLAPRLLAVEPAASGGAWLYLEAVRRVSAWPWRDLSNARELLSRVARFHASAALGAAESAAALPEWDFEGELAASAELTRQAVARCRRHPELSALARDLKALERMVLGLPGLRRQLLSERPFVRQPIHGDLHTGNALVRRRGRGAEPVLLDWGRARLGSPLEDVSAWLQSLGCWDEEGRRRHDSLLAAYLSATGAEQRITSQLRALYWTAGACNALAGALLHQLSVAADERQGPASRRSAARAAQDWLRVIRRADAWCH